MKVSELRHPIRRRLDFLTRKIRAVRSATANGAAPEKRAANEQVNQALDQIRHACAELEQHTVQRARAADELVRNRPYQSLAIAASFGVVLGFMLSRHH